MRRLPFRYEDRSQLSSISGLQPGQAAVVSGRVLDSRLIRTRRRGFTLLEAAFDDGTGTLRTVWFNRPYLARALSPGRQVILFGTPEIEKGGILFKNPDHEIFEEGEERDPVHLGRVVGIYRRLGRVTGKWLRKVIFLALEALEEDFPSAIGAARVARALREVHFPEAAEFPRSVHAARDLLAREELLAFCGGLEQRREHRRGEKVPQWRWDAALTRRLAGLLPFSLTGAQQRALAEIGADFQSGRPMARLLQGDVGSGKTAVAVLAALVCVENGRQAALMAPTEILAEQHAEVLGRWLAASPYRLALLTGRIRESARRPLRAALRAGEIDLLVGTHALVERPVQFRDLGLAIVDEQHRFGVAHRARLTRKGVRPHVLVLTATPIPRSLAWTLFGDLDVSLLDEKPPGRGRLRTYLRGFDKRARIYAFVGERIRAGERAYVVAPVIEESKREIAAAERTASDLGRFLPEARIGLLHGRLAPENRQTVMRKFAEGALDALVATTVIEVGIDVPEATVMVIENAERFGLAQLHQLRGRIGRGAKRSYCILLAAEGSPPEALERLAFLARTDDGFKIAEKDLELRGPGDLLGRRQAGVPEFSIADPVRDVALLRTAREEARRRCAGGEILESELFPAPGDVIQTA